MATDTKKEINIDMNDKSEMKTDAISQAKIAVETLKVEAKVSKYLKDFFDNKYGPNWHCIVGKNFHAFATYEAKHFISFYEGPICILLYKMG